VDNASVDDSLAMVGRKFPNVEILALETNLGFSKANNIAVEKAQGEYLCILNPDTIMGEEVFVKCLAFAKAEYNKPLSTTKKQFGFVGVQLIDGSGTYLPESKRHVPTPQVARQKLMGNDSSYYYNEIDKNERGAVDVLVGAFMFCKTEVYRDCNGFDERYFMYGEDIDLSYTALQKGYQNYYLGDLKVLHFKGESTTKDRKYYDRFYGAMDLFYDKYFKRSATEQWIVKAAIHLMVRTKSINTKPYKSSDFPDRWVTNSLESKLESKLEIEPIKLNSLKGLKNLKLIWDSNSYDFQQIIEFMACYKKSFQYRFVNREHDKIIGSDRSEDRGVVKNVQ
jgi:GT2 family glycosyltransferase